jgi:hypothetical protein
MRRTLLSSILGGIFGCLMTGLVARAADPNVTQPPTTSNAPQKSDGPKIEFSEVLYDFGKVDSGELVKHSYFFTNTGNQALEVSEVRPGCGCTTTGAWDKHVEPGKTGTIPIQFNSFNYDGQVQKTVTVTCNDPDRTNVILQLKGNVWKPITVAPVFVMFNPGPDSVSNETRVVKIVNNLEEGLTLSNPECTNDAFKAELKTVREGKEFQLLVTAVAPFQTGSAWAPISLKASSTKTPTITVNCYVNVQPALAAVPAQIVLPPGPLTNAPIYSISIHNNTTNSMSLSEPAINVEGAELKLSEVQAGHVFKLTASFPTGFKSPPGKAMEVSIKTNNPKYPFIKLPIIQMPAPSRAPQAAATAPPTAPAALAVSSGSTTPASQNPTAKSPAAVGPR